ncbi:MAG: glycoside hydrolase family 15 protein [Bacteriovoracaceae bacterium]|nr:glycoside hydrolase family 15 protein [Bacteriovoracaceae bacterium]
MKNLFLSLIVMMSLSHAFAQNLEQWMTKQEAASWEKLLKNLSPADTKKGAVIASPQRKDPDYFFHWVRDAALVMDVLMTSSRETPNQNLNQKIEDYIQFSLYLQEQATLTDLGEPKYHVDGTSFNGPWGRPQNDSPALRALYLVRHTQFLLDRGVSASKLTHLYRNELPARSLIKRDLEYVAHHWTEAGFDLWEEVKGAHFYTLMVTRQSLLEGAELARRLGDTGAADHYSWQSVLVENRLQDFIQDGHFVTTLDRVEGVHYKDSNLDTCILLAFLHVGNKGAFKISDVRLVRSMQLLEEAFNRVYPLNQRGLKATALGRYPEDTYYGGNPWILTTLAAAEYEYRLAQQTGKFAFLKKGDEYMERVQFHARADGALAEQWDRNSGYHVSADELTWSHASFITAMRERKAALKKVRH